MFEESTRLIYLMGEMVTQAVDNSIYFLILVIFIVLMVYVGRGVFKVVKSLIK